ncbi:ABC transporter C family member 14-like [Nicotiana sylvestris]|uniref:ABC-type xenobiotic transporter n=2 Tax=Nicotiana TaxID=4085 RepID=A0A1S4C639_TOBAC|nr:PREDICTED: ABC transporter C family member 14-like [Nicotiana sylvestris]XP_009792252.1 PREDICTED: ABC transporter C family member 14-like [Nicotiana sylvestris]XP_009792253.1 PREDICTED: ABC transporter C family member 14-like [Nicotiana sylvestris]XP_016496670.1 PREDICTED: ABC transporter C family member 14-like [Nicotiana tabacum]XP_016496671.1 PREDICTED: ABC transporter C family member 14-like [Nicotiana tabacum]XP_016496672.1 PREDICTED: ABC transporter C family member 14-like [Nicotiana
MAADSWLTSLECSASEIQSSDNSSFVSVALKWLKFIFLIPCSQRILLSSVDLLFLLILIVLAVKKLSSRFLKNGNSTSSLNKPLLVERPQVRVTFWFYASLAVTAVLAIAYSVLCILAFTQGVQSTWEMTEAFFRLFQALTYLVIFVLIVHEKRFVAVSHPMPLRVYWAMSYVIVLLFAITGTIRLILYGKNVDLSMRMDDIAVLVSFPLYLYLLIVAIKGSSGICTSSQHENSRLETTDEMILMDPNVSGYGAASLFSKAVWNWMNPLLSKGYQSPLKLDEVPSLPPGFRAERLADFFEKNWPKPGENVKYPVLMTLIRCFWRDIVIISVLAIVQLAVMYVGPVLIQSFISFASGDRTTNPYEGYYLVLILFVSKVIEVLSAHHFNFKSELLGMKIRSSLITTLYKKGLRLTCSSRQAHGVGQIVNYMAVDSQQLSDMMLQLHSLWMMPLQLAASLLLLYYYLGVSMFAAFGLIVGSMICTLYITRKNNQFQFELMMKRDSRMKAINEMLGNMRVIKFQAWEEHFKEKIQSLRNEEFSWLSKFTYLLSCNLSLLWSLPPVIAALTFLAAILCKIPLDAATVFTATTVFRILQDPIRTFPQSLMSVSQAMVSLGRLDGYMTSGELDHSVVERVEGCSGRIAVEVKDGNFSWEDDGDQIVLKEINVEIRKGELAAIVGMVGSGKSSLLASILGELHKLSGEVRVCGATAYVAQTSWIQNATIRENILFGSPMNNERYRDVVRVCSLEKDLEILEHGDQTEIGERGINLSGGQKQRIQLARAVYQDRDVYLLDDIFSAVDAQTGSEIFKECVRGALKDKTIVLVTHQVDFLHNADLILVMRDGKIVQSGKYEELLELGMDFGDLVAAHENSMELVESSTGENLPQTPRSPHQVTPKSPQKSQEETNGESTSLDQQPKNSLKLIEEEERETGHVSFDVYKQYCTEAFGWWGVIVVLIISALWQGSTMLSDYWLAYETSEDHIFSPSLFINVYSIIAAISCIFVISRSFLVAFLGLKTAQHFFDQILDSILHAPMSFFDTTPSGRILSRASTDQAYVDFMIPLFLSIVLLMYFTLIGMLFITCQSAWPTIFLMIPLVWLNIWYRRYYIASSRELTRLSSITKAPILHHFSETISGIMTVRCFRKEDNFFQGNVERVNANLQMDFHSNASNEWLGLRLEFIGSILICIATIFMVLLPSFLISPEYVGLALSYGLPLNGVLFWTVYMSCMVENRMVSVERIKQFIRIPSEASWRRPNCLPSLDWPYRGDIDINNLKVRYRSNTPLVLKGISLRINGGEKIGIVGRTGSGKSTLIQVFFRLVEPSAGTIIIDGVDICKLGLHDLRSRFGIIPQEPVLFQGTVRSNIDPLGQYSDDEIWKSLERCQLKDVVAAKPEKLDASVVDSGENWSVGQRQLLCLGRVMLKNSKILFMDEATASVDSQTDAVIQKIIREDFEACTIITIAHRIPTVIDCDHVLVIDDGWAKEYDRPATLLERPSIFAALVQEYSIRSTGL